MDCRQQHPVDMLATRPRLKRVMKIISRIPADSAGLQHMHVHMFHCLASRDSSEHHWGCLDVKGPPVVLTDILFPLACMAQQLWCSNLRTSRRLKCQTPFRFPLDFHDLTSVVGRQHRLPWLKHQCNRCWSCLPGGNPLGPPRLCKG